MKIHFKLINFTKLVSSQTKLKSVHEKEKYINKQFKCFVAFECIFNNFGLITEYSKKLLHI